ncbi:glutaredoxin-like protein [Encephalitozoon intestinalis ATCC 50506]|uniref:Glutaredoxin-like protein n=1 Tax=Encephalitozoon intestinalis (strain ATCC 50506) TaxID=876142 RepID=E0S705_ENCIT|nr:glutaredoxin-like protein [Encephalitozoon intestinalis ATCC 50506]ADM11591.1 glutaredoxin-like protein [Encephalitozoon intestinalis ATCC 50506]UTX45309.1 glutaredoxin-like protein [Encephalitozoon intestinalis]
MNGIEDSNPFEELKEYEVVVAYDDENKKLSNVMKDRGLDYVEVNLAVSEKLRTEFMKHFRVSELPVLLIEGIPALDDPSERIKEYIERKEKKSLEKIQSVIDPNKITLFIKGSPEHPRCGFTKSLIEILYGLGVTRDKIEYLDVLSDEDIRERLKEINRWPTFPQVYIRGRFIGGLDIVRKMSEKGKLKDELSGII